MGSCCVNCCFRVLRETEDVLDEDDYELLRDNNINYRPKVVSFVLTLLLDLLLLASKSCSALVMSVFLFDHESFLKFLQESKKFKRLKKAQRDSDDVRFGFSDEEFDGSAKGGRTAEEKLKRSLFGDDEGI